MMAGCTFVLFGTIWANIFIAMLLSLIVAALIYMVGNIVRKQEYIEFSKGELYNFFITGALVLSFSAIILFATELSCPQAGQGDLFTQALVKISTILYGSVYTTLKNLFQIMLEISTLSNMVVEYGGIKFNPFGGLRYFYTSLNVVSFIMESVFASLYIQMVALMVFKEIALTIMFPIGIFLRALPMTRDAGTFMMVLAFSLYTVYPYIYVVTLEAYDKIQESATYDNLTRSFYSNTGAVYGAYKAFQTVENGLFWGLTFANYSSIRNMFLELGGQLVIALVIPAIAILLTTAMVSSMMKFIKEVTA
jgi:hypothetical protein